MTFEILFVLGLIALAFVLFISERFSLDVTALLILSILFVGGFLTVEEAISGFANPAVITIALLFILGVSVFTLFSMMKIWLEAFWKDASNKNVEKSIESTVSLWRPNLIVNLFSVLIILCGVFAGSLFDWTADMGNDLFEAYGYIESVLRLKYP